MLTIVGFVLFVLFFDENNYFDTRELKDEIKELESQKSFYLERIREDSTIIEKLKDDDFLEQYARENFLMKRDSDFVYVMEP